MALAVCVFCASSDLIPQRYIELAAEVGAETTRRGHTLVTGGGSVSCMGAVARGARAGGARTLGGVPRALLGPERAEDDRHELPVSDGTRRRNAATGDRAGACP